MGRPLKPRGTLGSVEVDLLPLLLLLVPMMEVTLLLTILMLVCRYAVADRVLKTQ
jgi:hypothetical protein